MINWTNLFYGHHCPQSCVSGEETGAEGSSTDELSLYPVPAFKVRSSPTISISTLLGEDMKLCAYTRQEENILGEKRRDVLIFEVFLLKKEYAVSDC